MQAEDPDDPQVEVTQTEADKVLLRLFHAALKGTRLPRALGLAGRLALPRSLEGALKLANHHKCVGRPLWFDHACSGPSRGAVASKAGTASLPEGRSQAGQPPQVRLEPCARLEPCGIHLSTHAAAQ